MNDIHEQLSKNLNYRFSDPQLLELALTHRSANSSNNERLEYLGDAILGFIVAEALFLKLGDVSEGVLTRKRAALVKKETLAELARKLELGQFIQLGSGERKTGGWRRDSILSNTLEAIIGAIYLDSDFDRCKKFIVELYDVLLSSPDPEDSSKDSKTELQEYLQSKKLPLPSYTVVAEEGEAHKRVFQVECVIAVLDKPILATGKSKRIAEQQAARFALKQIYKTA